MLNDPLVKYLTRMLVADRMSTRLDGKGYEITSQRNPEKIKELILHHMAQINQDDCKPDYAMKSYNKIVRAIV